MLDFLLYALYFLIALIVFILCVKITVIINYEDENLEFILRIFFININITKIMKKNKQKKNQQEKNKKNKKPKAVKPYKNIEKQDNIDDKKTTVNDKDKKQETIEPDKIDKHKSDKKKISDEIDKYLGIASDVIDILEQFTYSFYFKQIYADLYIGTADSAKTAEIIGGFYTVYGTITPFLFSNFIVKDYNISFCPLWDTDKFVITGNANIIICTRLIKILKNIKYKQINEIRKKVLL